MCATAAQEGLGSPSWWYFRSRQRPRASRGIIVPLKSLKSPSARAIGQRDLPACCTGPRVWLTGHLIPHYYLSSLPDNGVHASCVKVNLMHVIDHLFLCNSTRSKAQSEKISVYVGRRNAIFYYEKIQISGLYHPGP